MSSRSRSCSSLIILGLAAWITAGCGFERLQQETLPNQITGISLPDLKDIQEDERLTDAEKREAIRTAIGAPMDSSGDRLVDFLLNFNVP